MVRFGDCGVPPSVTADCDEPGSSKFTECSFGNGSPGPFLISSWSPRTYWFANLGSFRTSVATAAQIETNAQGYVSKRRFDPETGTGVSDHWPVMIDLFSRP